MPDGDTVRGLRGWLSRLGSVRPDEDARPDPVSPPKLEDGPLVTSQGLRKFLAHLETRPAPVLLDLGPVVGSNIAYLRRSAELQGGPRRPLRRGRAPRSRRTRRGASVVLREAVCARRGVGRRRPPVGRLRLPEPAGRAGTGERAGPGAPARRRGARVLRQCQARRHRVHDVRRRERLARAAPPARVCAGAPGLAAEPRHHQDVRRDARVRFLPAPERLARNALPQGRRRPANHLHSPRASRLPSTPLRPGKPRPPSRPRTARRASAPAGVRDTLEVS